MWNLIIRSNEDAAKTAHAFVAQIVSLCIKHYLQNGNTYTCDDAGLNYIQCKVELISGSGETFQVDTSVDTEIFWFCKETQLSHDQSWDQSIFEVSEVYQNRTIIFQNFLNQTFIINDKDDMEFIGLTFFLTKCFTARMKVRIKACSWSSKWL